MNYNLISLVGILIAIGWYSLPEDFSLTYLLDGEFQEDTHSVYVMKNLSAFVVGATGEVGKAVVKELANNNFFEKVTIIGRREMELPKDASYSKVTQKIVDFEKLSEYKSEFADYDVGFCALGTTRGKAGVDGFIRVDHDYVVDSAKLAKEGGCKHFNLVSSGGANKNSYFLYPRVKGQVEEELSGMGFDRLTIWRPAVLLVDRVESRPFEAVMRCLIKPLDYFRFMSIEVPIFARVMVNHCFKTVTSAVEIQDNRAISRLDREQSSKKEETTK